MCSASQPSSRPRKEAIRSARHFFPSRALPPYPEPTEMISLASGKWAMNRRSGLQSNTECVPRLNSSVFPKWSQATFPIRVMIRMLRTT